MSFVVAIDGPAGSGKGTITKLVGEKMNLINIDTGAMYRCVTLECINHNIKSNEIEKISSILENIDIQLKKENGKEEVFLNEKDVTKDIRSVEVNLNVAEFAAIKCVRDKMTPIQREMGKTSNIIMEGRDIGTTVFPNANVKIYLDCSIEERARRRYNELINRGLDVNYDKLLEDIIKRDHIDSTRAVDPLRKADDAIEIDSSNYNINEVTEIICNFIENDLQ